MVQQCRRPWSSHRYKHSQRIVDVTVVIPREVPTFQSEVISTQHSEHLKTDRSKEVAGYSGPGAD